MAPTGPKVFLGWFCLLPTVATLSLDPTNLTTTFTRSILDRSPLYGNFVSNRSTPQVDSNSTVGIIGSGITGLYAALLLQSLGINYEIIEANDRPGGRIWTHYSDPEAWAQSRPGDPAYYDYAELGAMRVPQMAYMDRVIGPHNSSLINHINAGLTGRDRLNLIPFAFNAENTFLLYNDILRPLQSQLTGDPFKTGISHGGPVSDSVATQDTSKLWNNIVQGYASSLSADFESGFEKLLVSDSLSVRDYLRQQGYTDADVDWLETNEVGTGSFTEQSVTEEVMEDWVFGAVPDWVTVEGGMSRIVSCLVKILETPVQLSERVTSIGYYSGTMQLNVTTNSTSRQYDHVINTVPLGAMRAMDMGDLKLAYGKKQAMRSIRYDAAMKIAMRFKTRWWEALSEPIRGGQSLSDLPIRRCVYPSYGTNTTGAAGTMLASYVWGADALRLASYTSTPEGNQHLVDLTLQNLAQMNNVTYSFLQEQYLDSFPWSWYDSEFSLGAYALYGPSQFTNLLPSLLAPAANGRLHFAGEALSTGNGWIVGGLNSAYRAVAEILATQNRADLLDQLVQKWGIVDEIDMGWYFNTTVTEPENVSR